MPFTRLRARSCYDDKVIESEGVVKWEMGISAGIAYKHPIAQVLEPIQRSGFRTIEVATAREHLDLCCPAKLTGLARQIEELGLRVHSMHAPFGHDIDLTDPDAGFRRPSLDLLTQAANALKVLGGGLYVIHPGGEDHHWIWDPEARLGRSVEGLSLVWEVCRERGLTLIVETPLPHLLGGDLVWLLDRIPLEGTGVCIDTSHCSVGGFLYEAIERFAGRTLHIQASDNCGVTDDHLPPGEGFIDWARLASSLERAEYRGLFMLEVTGDGDVDAHVKWAAACALSSLPDVFRPL
jgi:sugar phosphate isomerase/epimerase